MYIYTMDHFQPCAYVPWKYLFSRMPKNLHPTTSCPICRFRMWVILGSLECNEHSSVQVNSPLGCGNAYLQGVYHHHSQDDDKSLGQFLTKYASVCNVYTAFFILQELVSVLTICSTELVGMAQYKTTS